MRGKRSLARSLLPPSHGGIHTAPHKQAAKFSISTHSLVRAHHVSRSGSLDRSRRKYSSSSSAQALACVVCDTTFSNAEQLGQHVAALPAKHSSFQKYRDVLVSSDRSRNSDRSVSSPAFLDPYDSLTFSKHETVHSNMAIHATTPEAWERISRTRSFDGAISPDQTYDGLTSSRASSCAFTFLNVTSDRVLFPFSRYPRHLEAGKPVKVFGVPTDLMRDEELSMFYVASTPTQFGGHSFKTVYRSHVTFVRKRDLTLALTMWQLIDKTENRIFSLGNGGERKPSICTSVVINGESYSHVVVASFLNGLEFSADAGVRVADAGGVRAADAGGRVADASVGAADTGVRAIDGVKLGAGKDGMIHCPEPGCMTQVVSVPNLKKHYLTAEHVECDPLRCRECDKGFYMHADLERHVANVHESERLFKCTECNKSFAQRYDMLAHTATVHVNRRTFQCLECDKSFPKRTKLSDHVSAVHLGRKPFRCVQCNKSFSHREGLSNHVNTIHLKERAHRCGECDRTFSERGNLRAHMQGVHEYKRNGVLPHACAQCDKGFRWRKSLANHVAAMHRGDYFATMDAG